MIKEINSQVFFVKGAKKGLIYDLRKEYAKLIWINEATTRTLEKVINTRSLHLLKSETLKKLIDLDLFGPAHIDTSTEFPFFPQNHVAIKIKFVWIEVTNKCNLKCIHCYSSSSNLNHNFITIDDFHTAISEIKNIGCNKIQLTGGEPLLHPQIFQLIEIAHKKNIEVELFTNATLLSEKHLSFFREKNIKIAISILGDKKATELITKTPDSLNRVIKNIKSVIDNGIELRLSTTTMGVNINKVPSKLFNLPIRKTHLRLTGRASTKLLNSDIIRNRLITIKTFRRKIKSKDILNNFLQHPCFGSKIFIDSSLDIYPCIMENRIKYGNLKEDSLENILKRNMFYITLTKDKVNICKSCEFRYACFDCRPDSPKNFLDKPWYCSYDPYRGDFISEDYMINLILNQHS